MRRVLPLLGLVALLSGLSPALAGAAEPELAEKIRRSVLENMTSFVCGDTPCKAATAEELANPPISLERADSIVARGVNAAMADYCGLEWEERSFVPMMAYWRHEMKLPVRQMAMVGGIHGMAQGMTERYLADKGACTPELKAQVDARIDFRKEAMK